MPGAQRNASDRTLVQQLHECHDISLVLLGQDEHWLCGPGAVGICDDEEELSIVLGHAIPALSPAEAERWDFR